MIKKIKYPQLDYILDAKPRWTQIEDVKLIIYLSKMINGNIVEIGCNKGITTCDISKFNPDKKIFAVDFLNNKSLSKNQIKEIPLEIGSEAKNCKNIVWINKDSKLLNFNVFKNVEYFIIDGDHSLEGIRNDTEKAINYLKKNNGGIICWHDYHDNNPHWCNVKEYIDSLEYEIYWFETSWVAYMNVKSFKLFI